MITTITNNNVKYSLSYITYQGTPLTAIISNNSIYYSTFKIKDIRMALQYSIMETTRNMNKISSLRISEKILIISIGEGKRI